MLDDRHFLTARRVRCRWCASDFPAYYVTSGGVCWDCYEPPRTPRETRAPRLMAPAAVQSTVAIRLGFPQDYARTLAILSPRQRELYDAIYERRLTRLQVAEQLGIGRAAIARLLDRIGDAFARHGLPRPTRHPLKNDDVNIPDAPQNADRHASGPLSTPTASARFITPLRKVPPE